MQNCIIVSYSLFVSGFLFSHSLYLLNRSFLQNKPSNRKFILINGIIFVVSGSIFISSSCLLNLSHFDFSSLYK